MGLPTRETLFCPFPAQINPHADRVTQHTFDWIVDHDLIGGPVAYERFRDHKIGRLAARCYPRADLEALAVISDFCGWLFVLDDHCDESGVGQRPDRLLRLLAGFLGILECPDDPTENAAGPLAESFRDVCLRVAQQGTPLCVSRFTNSVHSYLMALTWEASNRAAGAPPSLEAYVPMRRRAAAMLPVIDLIEVAGRFELPRDVRDDSSLRALTRMAANVVCWANDIVYLEKELRHNDLHNLVIVLQHHLGCTLEEATALATRRHDDEVRAYMELESRVLPSPRSDGDVRRFVGGLRSWMRGNFDWMAESVRGLSPSAYPGC